MPKRKGKVQQEVSDDEDDYKDIEDEEEDDEAQGRGGSKRRKGASAFIDDAAEEDDDEEEDEEDEGPNRRKAKRNRFIDDIAAVDEDEEEDEDEDEDELINDEAAELPVEPPTHHYREIDRKMRLDDAADIAEYVKRFEQPTYEAAEEEAGLVSQQALLPRHDDPKLWITECKAGTEREAVISLLQKAHNMEELGTPLMIKSAFTVDHLKGYVYVEAVKEAYVMDAIRGLRIFRVSKGAKLVPLNEMVDAIRVHKENKTQLERDSWARMRAGAYKGDLCQVLDADYSTNTATIKVVPRLDYAETARRRAEGGGLPFGRQPGKVRPQAKAFSLSEAKEHNLPVEQKRDPDGGFFYLLGSARYKDGYLIRSVALRSLVPEETVPPIDELQRFNAVGQSSRDDETGASELDRLIGSLTAEDPGGAAAAAAFSVGDRVIVTEGDLKTLPGRVVRVADGQVEVMPTMEGLHEVIAFEPSQLQKHVAVGDFVVVSSGRHAGEKGMVIAVEGPVATIVSTTAKEELKVFVRALSEANAAPAAAPSADSLGEYQLHDLVILDQNTFGVIIGIEADSARILTNQGTLERPDIRVARKGDIKRSIRQFRGNPKFSTRDPGGATIMVGDMVDIADPRRASALGQKLAATVLFILRGTVFAQTRETMENGGFISVQARECRARGGGSRMDANPMATPSYGGGFGARMSVPSSPRLNGFGGGAAPPLQRGPQAGGFSARSMGPARHDSWVGKTVTIAKGPQRGYTGRVVSATETHVRMELEAQYKTVTVKIEHIKGPDGYGSGPSRPQMPARGVFSDPTATPMHPGGRTPMHPGSATPMHWGSQTPRWGSTTPAYDPTRTPMHAPAGWQTPSRPSESAWNPPPAPTPQEDNPPTPLPAATPTYAPNYASTPAYAATPYTPAETPAQTPGLVDLGIPGTPGFASAATPYADGRTPGTYAEGATPFSPAAPTPGMGPAQTPGLPPAAGGGLPDRPRSPGGAGGEDWGMWEGIEVQLPGGEAGVVRIADGQGSFQVEVGTLDDEGNLVLGPEPRYVTAQNPLQPLDVRKNDAIKILRGNFAGQAGKLMAVEGLDNIISLTGNDIKVVDRSTTLLGRFRATS